VPFKSVAARELLLPKQLRKLASGYETLFGRELPPVAYSWAGSFAQTKDGLPYIGPVPGMNPRLQFVLAYGGNGITYSVQAGDIVRAHLEGREHALDAVFGFGRREDRAAVPRAAGGQT
jgi:glycine/D-amino acid oxidase-like deaminating enzyme